MGTKELPRARTSCPRASVGFLAPPRRSGGVRRGRLALADTFSLARGNPWPLAQSSTPMCCPKGQLAAAVRAVGPGGDEQRHVVVRRRVGDAEADRHEVEERRLVRLGAEVVPDREHELVLARVQGAAADQRPPRAALGGGGGGRRRG